MDDNSSNQTLILPRGDGQVRVTVSARLLERAPWLPEGLEATIFVAGKWWPDEVFVGDGLDWVCHGHDQLMFFLPEWAVEIPVKPRKKRRAWLNHYLSILHWLVPDFNFDASENRRGWYLAQALHRNLSRYDSEFGEMFALDDFAGAVWAEWRKHLSRETARWRFVVFGMLMIPLVFYMLLSGVLLYAILWLLSRCVPGFRSARWKELRMRRRFKKMRREISTAIRKSRDERAIDEVTKVRSESE